MLERLADSAHGVGCRSRNDRTSRATVGWAKLWPLGDLQQPRKTDYTN